MTPLSAHRVPFGTLLVAVVLVVASAASAANAANAPTAEREPERTPPAPTKTTLVATAPSPMTSTSEEVDSRVVARLVADLESALRADDLAVGKAKLDELVALLPERSLTLLRMQAWYAHRSGDAAGAMAMYGEVVQRVPQDRNAAINLAMLEAAQGDVDRASQRLRDLRAVGGESADLAAAMARVGAMPR